MHRYLGYKLAGVVVLLLWVWNGCSDKITFTETINIPGSLTVYSVPPGAAIYLDSIATGKTTSATIPEVLPGLHRLKLTLANYSDTTLLVNVPSGATAKVTVDMSSQYGTLLFVSNPSGAQIYQGNRYLGNTPISLSYVVPDSYVYVLKQPGYIDYSQSAAVLADQIDTLYYDWDALGFGSLLVTSTPAGAKITVDGAGMRPKTPTTVEKVSAGYHRIGLALPGYISAFIDTTLPSGRVLELHDSLQPVIIVINSSPPGANLFIDDNYYGLTPYTSRGVLIEGWYQIRVSKLGAQEYIQNLYLSHGDTVNVNLNILYDVIFYDDFNRPVSSLASDWSIYDDQWREWPKGTKETFQTEALCLAIPDGTRTCGYVYKRDSLYIGQVAACTLLIQQYNNSGYLAAFVNDEPLPGVSVLPGGTSKASLDKYIGRKIQLSFYGCPGVYLDNLMIIGYK